MSKPIDPTDLDVLDAMDREAEAANGVTPEHLDDEGPWPTPFATYKAGEHATNGTRPEPPPAPSLVQRLRDRLVRAEQSWITEPPPPLAYLVRDSRTGRGAIEAQGTGLLVAAGASGKGFTSLSLGIGVSTGTPWLGCMTIEHRGRVLFVSAEDAARTHLRYRLHTMARAMGVKQLVENFDILDVRDLHVPMLTTDGVPGEGTEALVEFIREHGPYALVVLDPVSRVAGASIDADNVAATTLLGCFEAISVVSGGFVLGCHHSSLSARKAGDSSTTSIRGATGLGDSARAVMTLSIERIKHGDADLDAHLGELVTVQITKANHVRAWDPIVMRRGVDGALFPLDETDRARVNEAREHVKPSNVKKEERVAEAAAKKEREAAEREGKLATARAADAAREAELAAAVLAAVTDRPEIGATDLRIAVRARAKCNADTADVAVERLVTREQLIRTPGKGKAVHYSLPSSCRASAFPPPSENPPVPPYASRREEEAVASPLLGRPKADEADEADEADATDATAEVTS